MTIRMQNLLVIPPIFLAMGLAVALLANRAADQEIEWGLREEARSLSVTVAEMAGERTEAALVRGDLEAEADLRGDLAALLRQGQALSILLYARAGQGRVVAVHRDAAAVELESTFDDPEYLTLSEQTFVGEVGPRGSYPEAFVSVAPIRDATGAEARGAAVVVIDASRVSERRAALQRRLVLLVLFLTLIGVAAALFLSARIGRQVRELREAGEVVAAGQYSRSVRVDGVKEVQDLSNTLGTMASILSDTLTRGRRALLVGDPGALESQAVRAYRSLRGDVNPSVDGIEVGVALVGDTAAGSFFGWAECGDVVTLWNGVVDVSGLFPATVTAGAVDRALARLHADGADDAEIREVVSAFPLDTLQIARFDRAKPDAAPLLESLAGPHPPAVVGGYGVLSSLPGPPDELLEGPLALFAGLPIQETADQLPLALPEEAAGIVLLFRTRSEPTGETP